MRIQILFLVSLFLTGCLGSSYRGENQEPLQQEPPCEITGTCPVGGGSGNPSGGGSGGGTTPGVSRLQKQIVTVVADHNADGKTVYLAKCPSGWLLTAGGVELTRWSHGHNRPKTSTPDYLTESWRVEVDPTMDHKDNAWNVYGVCIKSDSIRLERQVLSQTLARNGQTYDMTMTCPQDYYMTSVGTKLVTYQGGGTHPDTAFVQNDNTGYFHIGGPQAGHANNQWEASAVCIRPTLHTKSNQVNLIQRNGSQLGGFRVNCPANTTMVGGTLRFMLWQGGQLPDAFFPVENGYQLNLGGPQSPVINNQYESHLVCLETEAAT